KPMLTHAYPPREGRIAWGVNAPETGLNVLRGIRRPDCQRHFESEPGLAGGRAADDEAIVRLANTLARILKQLERRHRQKAKTGRPPSTSVAASLSEHYAT